MTRTAPSQRAGWWLVVLALGVPCAGPAGAQTGTPPRHPPPTAYGPPAEVPHHQDSLVQVAIRSPDRMARVTAIARLAAPGATWDSEDDPRPGRVIYPGTVSRLRQVYPHASGAGREAIVRMLRIQAERTEALAFLSELVLDGSLGAEHNLIGEGAVDALSTMGQRGDAELQRRHASGEGPELVRKALDRLAQTGYRRPPEG